MEQFVNEIWKPCEIEQGGTNRYTNQDIVQTTNSSNTSNENCSGKEIA